MHRTPPGAPPPPQPLLLLIPLPSPPAACSDRTGITSGRRWARSHTSGAGCCCCRCRRRCCPVYRVYRVYLARGAAAIAAATWCTAAATARPSLNSAPLVGQLTIRIKQPLLLQVGRGMGAGVGMRVGEWFNGGGVERRGVVTGRRGSLPPSDGAWGRGEGPISPPCQACQQAGLAQLPIPRTQTPHQPRLGSTEAPATLDQPMGPAGTIPRPAQAPLPSSTPAAQPPLRSPGGTRLCRGGSR